MRDLEAARPSYSWELFGWVEPLPRWQEEHAALHAAAAGPMVLLLLALFAVYGLALALVAGRHSAALTAIILGAGALSLLIQLFGAALLSNDVYSYIMHGRIFAIHGGDPQTQPPSQFRGDMYFRLLEWRNSPSSRGPLWTLLSAGLARAGGEHIGLTVLLFRVVGLVATLATAGLIWWCVRQRSPQHATLALATFLWNPLVVIEGTLSGHSDIVLAALLASAWALHLRGRRPFATAAFVLATQVKFISGLILPLYLLLILREPSSWQRRTRDLAACGVSALVVLVLVSIATHSRPDVPVFQALQAEGGRYTNTVHELVFTALRLHFGEAPGAARAPWQRDQWLGTRADEPDEPSVAMVRAERWLRAFTWSAFAVFATAAATRVVGPHAFLVWSTAVLLAFYWVVATWIQPWYVLWALALAALVPTTAAAHLTVLLSATSLSVYITGGYDSDSPLWWLNDYRALPVFVLPVVLLAVLRLQRLVQARWLSRPAVSPHAGLDGVIHGSAPR